MPLQGITTNSILFGQSAAFTGGAKQLGIDFRDGILAAFNEANRYGGVNGRRLLLATKDDGYEPERAIANTYSLINEKNVFSLIGAVGTPTSQAVLPLVAKTPLMYIGPLTGASFLRESKEKNVVNIRVSYAQETQEMITRLKNDLNIKRVAVFFQNDSFGQSGLQGVKKAVAKTKDMKIVSIGSYIRNTAAVKGALLDMQSSNPEAVIIIGSYAPAVAFIQWAKKINMNPVYMAVSFVGVSSLAKGLKKTKARVFVTQVVPYSFSKRSKLSRNYIRAMNRVQGANKSYVSLEGYVAGRVAIEAIKRIRGKITYKKFANQFQSGTNRFNIDGFRLVYKKEQNQGSEKVYLTKVQGGDIIPVQTLKDN